MAVPQGGIQLIHRYPLNPWATTTTTTTTTIAAASTATFAGATPAAGAGAIVWTASANRGAKNVKHNGQVSYVVFEFLR